MNELAPIVVFAFNRLDNLRALIHSLHKNEEAQASMLYIFVDGPRKNRENDNMAISAIRDYVREIDGFREVYYTFSDVNKGLGASIIEGVSEVIRIHGKAIILEDDLILSSNCLSYMNEALNRYEGEKQIFSICAWGCKIKRPVDYKFDFYTCIRSTSWGWATWADRWNSIDWELNDWDECKRNRKKFNDWGGSDCYKMLLDWKKGRNKSWAIRFVYNQFLQNKLSLFPFVSMIDNRGFDNKGTNCPRYCRTKWIFEDNKTKYFSFPDEVGMNFTIYKAVMAYRTIPCRAKAKIINCLLNVKYNILKL